MAAETLFPYAVLDASPTLSLSTPTVDGEPAPLLARERRVDLSELADGWSEARVNARVEVPVDELELLGVRKYAVVLTLHCGPTNLRATVPLEPSGGERSGHWTGAIDLPRMMIRDRATIHATVAGTVAEVPHRWLGASPEFLIDLHPPRTPEISGGHVPVMWRDFGEAGQGQNPIDPSLHDEMSFVDLSLPEGPVIYLNERVSELRRLLEIRTGRTRAERVIREMALDLVAVPAMVSMANAALAAAGPPDAGEAQWPGNWHEQVLRSLLPLMYPDREPEAALATAVRGLTDGEDAQDVQSRLLAAAARLVRVTPHVRNVIKTFEED